MPGRVVVIGVGNAYRRDDGVGPAVLALLDRAGPYPGVELIATDGESSRLIDAWTGASLAYVVDAVRTVSPSPGRIHRISVPDPASRPRAGAASSHGLGLGEAVELARMLDRLPGRLELFAVEVADTGFGEALSDPVAAAATQVAQLIRARLAVRSDPTPSAEVDPCA
jgi:hydrogenase maturation protease